MLPYFTRKVRTENSAVLPGQISVISFIFFLSGCGLFGNRGPEEISENELPVRSEYRKGHTVKNSFPLPSMTPLWLDQIRGTKRIASRIAYRGWDMNDDGRFDMLESLTPHGSVIFRAYDLDFDGLVDEVEQVRKESVERVPGKPMELLIDPPEARSQAGAPPAQQKK